VTTARRHARPSRAGRTTICEAAFNAAVSSVVSHGGCVEVTGPTMGHHCWRLRAYCEILGRDVGLGTDEMNALRAGAVLHDIGKVGIPASILLKPGALSDDELRIMRQHTIIGEKLCRPVGAMRPILPLIRHHHEHWDGSGYPDGLRGTTIPRVVRVLQIIDAYDALRSERPYRGALSTEDAVLVLRRETDGGKWDPSVMQLAVPLLLQTVEERFRRSA
jgi:putative two-component system response regulator